MTPKKISRPQPNMLKAEWNDGFESIISLKVLRDNCPCAECNEAKRESGSSNLLQTFAAGKYKISKLNQVGNYALNVEWEDGHSTGIYSWDLFRDIFEKNKLNDKDIK